MNKIIKIIIFLIIILSIILIIKINKKSNNNLKNYNTTKQNVLNNNNTKQNNNNNKLYIKQHYINENNFIKTVEGIVVNNTNKTYKSVEIKVQCYDKDKNKISGTAGDFINQLKPGETWKFKVFINSETKNYEIGIKGIL